MPETRTTFDQETSWGPRLTASGAIFRLWAPAIERLELAVEKAGEKAGDRRFHDMHRDEGGWWSIETDAVAVGDGYGFRVNGGTVVPDPAARAQIGDVHSLSRLVDPHAYVWKTAAWKGRPWHETVFYEMHVGTFTPEGTFDAAIGKLDYLVETGITCIELMPVAQFGGQRGWGYDGVLLYAPHEVYGGEEGLKRLVDAAHERGLMVFLDVVYNHFGPDGNYIGLYAPEFFHPEIHTAWGAAIAYENAPVRDFMIDNALFWLNEYRIDGLRLDAIDSIEDMTDEPLVRELAARVREKITGRHVHLTSEDARNIAWHIQRDDKGQPLLVSGEWNDDFHHCAHVLATHEEEGYYSDYVRNSVKQMARSLAEGFVYQGEHSRHRDKEVGERSDGLPPTAFVNFIQNHDQIGNRAFGDRLTDLASRRVIECLQAILLLSPQIPLIFMGEEFGDTNPFCFFTDFDGDLGDLVREGRRAEFKKFAAFHDAESRKLIPDPNSEATFRHSAIDWSMVDKPTNRRRLYMVRKLLQLRRDKIMPLLEDIPPHSGSYAVSDGCAFVVSWVLKSGQILRLFANLDDEPWTLPDTLSDRESGELLFAHPRHAEEDIHTGSLSGPSVVFRLTKMLQIRNAPDA
ncbi:malto-oligosyltrehalose trehalohydrolase [Aureimonas glaciei]|uniref:Malto-oligosyltrehalose trehalohydrolase n=1 Tax=Aureimonas glaciei TaxID=1776957 RepID=A0A917DI13_9HYPH|nr:malto-oligosyltrehalose trehalohydrolase [Aureimonas glaciei]GGD36929.1 malto-oligosyltrehalose trehalohydrolase [Aureimonas glaciei]